MDEFNALSSPIQSVIKASFDAMSVRFIIHRSKGFPPAKGPMKDTIILEGTEMTDKKLELLRNLEDGLAK